MVKSTSILQIASKDTEIHLLMYPMVVYMVTLKLIIGTLECYTNPTFGDSQ